MRKINSITLIIILCGFLASVLMSKYNLDNHDINIVDGDQVYHKMIKTDPYRYLSHGSEIKNQIIEGEKFFNLGRENYTKYLPPRIAALYYYFFDIEFSSNPETKQVNSGNHFFYLFFQCLLYYFSVLCLYFSIFRSVDRNILLFAVLFLCIEPTIFQYHSTFWSESIFFSIQLIIMSLIFSEKKNILNFFLIGIFIGLLSLQKQIAIFYIVPIILYFLFFDRRKIFRNFSFVIIGFYIIQIFIGLNNYYRSGKFYIMTADTKVEMHRNMVVKVVSKKLKISHKEFKELEGEVILNWINLNNIEIDYNSNSLKKEKGFMSYRRSVVKESDRFIVDKFIRKRTFHYISEFPVDFFKHALQGAIHAPLLNPFHIYSEHNFRSSEIYYLSKKHDELILPRIVYSSLIYLLVFFGLVYFLKKKEYKLLFYLTISSLYFFATIFWHGNTRYFLPSFIYLSFFFGAGINYIASLIKKNNYF
jgi:hypothetical protein